ncbi:MAG: FHA domain-containing protein [Propionibacteriaceae bacterium]|nr:FHA domain-containing protein [Propionibacteriaceae bacterium]
MRRQLGDRVVVILDAQRRAVAHVIQWVPAVLLVVSTMGFAWLSEGTFGVVLSTILSMLGLGGWVWSAWLIVTRSQTLGSVVQRFSYVRENGVDPASGALLGKMLAEGALEVATCGLAAISFQATYRDGQHWLDRVFHVIAVQPEPQTTAPPAQAAPRAEVTPAAPRPQAQPQSQAQSPAPRVKWNPPGPQAASPAGAQPFPPCPRSQVPAAPPPSSTPQSAAGSQSTPARPFGQAVPTRGNNPWAASPSAPVFPPLGFASAGTEAADDDQAGQETAIVPGARPHMDATVIDTNPMVPRPDPVLVLDDGQRITVDGPLVLGRNPVPPPSHASARPVKLIDATMRLSKTHLVVLAELDGLKVIDIGATNGVFLESDGERSRLVVRSPHRLLPNQLIHFGGRTLRLIQ